MIQLASIRIIRPAVASLVPLSTPRVATTSVSLSSLFVLSLLLSALFLPSAAVAAGDVYYEYDDLDRVTKVMSNGTEVIYAYDDVGNRFVVTVSGPQGVPEPGGAAPLGLGVLLLSMLWAHSRRAARSGTREPASPIARSGVRIGAGHALLALLIATGAAAPVEADLPPGFRTAEMPDPALFLANASPSSASAVSAAEAGSSLVATHPGNATEVTSEIASLALALKHDVDLIYEFVASEIDYDPIWGSHKGALGTLLDREGGDFEQASLMIALLRESGYEASYVYGQQRIAGADVVNWLGIPDDGNLLATWIANSGRAPGSNTVFVHPDDRIDVVDMERVWVNVRIDGTDYVFDPALKVHTIKPGIDVGAAMGYDRANLLAAALAGATVTPSSVQNLNDASLRQMLAGLSANLVQVIRNEHPGATMDDIVGGREIVPPSDSPRQTGLPGQRAVFEQWPGEIPAAFRACLRVALPGFDVTFNTDAIAGRRLTIFYGAGSSQTSPVLRLDDGELTIEVVAVGTPVTAGTPQTLQIEAAHPFSDDAVDQSGTISINAGGSYLVLNDWAGSREGRVRRHELRQRANTAFQASQGLLIEPILGESLAVFAASWLAQVQETCELASRLVAGRCFSFHNIGIAGQTDSPFVDIPFSIRNVISNAGDQAAERAAFFATTGHSSVLEGGVIEQLQPDLRAVSTVALAGVANDQSASFFEVTAATFTAIQPQLVNYDANELARVQSALDQGARVILPRNGNLAVDDWSGMGFLSITEPANGGFSLGYIISGGLNGGFGASDDVLDPKSEFSTQAGGHRQSDDPIDLVTGDFLYEEVDLTVGSQPFPLGLSFKKSYNSGSQHRDGPLGLGWTHNFDLQAEKGSDGFQAFGKDSPVDAVAAIAEMFVSVDLLSGGTSTSASELVVAMLAQRWFMDQRTDNIVTVRQPDRTSVFVRLPDGGFSPPPGSASTLLEEQDGRMTLTTKDGIGLSFRPDGQISAWQDRSENVVMFSYSADKLARVDDAAGHHLSFIYTGERIESVTDGFRSVIYAYDSSGNLTTSRDAADQVTSFDYDPSELLFPSVSVTDAFTYGNFGLLKRVFTPANPSAPRVVNTYDVLGHVIAQRDANGNLWTYHIAGTRSEEIDPTGASKVNYYDDRGRAVREIDALVFETVTEYDGEDRVVLRIEPEENFSQFEYDERHNVTKVTAFPKPGSPLAPIVREMIYEPIFNRATSETDPRGGITRFSYDDSGNLLEVEQPTALGQTPITTFTYNGRGQVLTQTDAEGTETAFGYDPATADLLTRTEDVGGLDLVTTMAYNDVGDVIFESDPRGNRVLLEPDALGRVIRTQAPAPFNFVTRLKYDEEGHLILTERQMGDPAPWQTTAMSYTLSGKLETVTDPEQQVTRTTYDSLDRVASQIDALGRTTQFRYTLRGELERILDPYERPMEIRTYTRNGQLASVTDANGNTTVFQYDGFDRRERTVFPDGTFEQLTYDAASNVVERRIRASQSILFSYDALGRVFSKSPPDDFGIIFGYDRMGRLKSEFQAGAATTFKYDALGRLIEKTDRSGRTVGYQYDGAGNRTRLTYPNGHFVTYEYDELNRLRGIRDAGATQDIVSYGYDSLSRRISTTRHNGTSTARVWEFDDDLGSLSHQFPGGPASWTYEYDDVHNRTKTSISAAQFRFDLSQLIQTTYATNELNQYTVVNEGDEQHGGVAVAPGYDMQGNLGSAGIDHYDHDSQNRLVEASRSGIRSPFSARYFYDDAGQRVRKDVDGVTTQFVLDGNQLLEEYDGHGNLLRRYVHAGLDEPVRMNTSAGAEFYYHQDGLGSVVALTNGSGFLVESYAYGPYGETVAASAVSNPFRYTGREYDPETGLYYYRARYYSPRLGRFLEPDPIGFGDGLNVYAYVGNNPINFVDPLGLFQTGQSGSGALDLGSPTASSGPRSLAEVRALNDIFSFENTVGPVSPETAGLFTQLTNSFGNLVVGAVGGSLVGNPAVGQTLDGIGRSTIQLGRSTANAGRIAGQEASRLGRQGLSRAVDLSQKGGFFSGTVAGFTSSFTGVPVPEAPNNVRFNQGVTFGSAVGDILQRHSSGL